MFPDEGFHHPRRQRRARRDGAGSTVSAAGAPRHPPIPLEPPGDLGHHEGAGSPAMDTASPVPPGDRATEVRMRTPRDDPETLSPHHDE